MRTFGYGFSGVLLGLYLLFLGGGATTVFASLGLSLASGAALNVVVGRYGDRFGRRRSMALFGGLMAVSGTVLAVAPDFTWALLALAIGALSPTGTEVSPFLSVEQAIVADIAPPGRRTRAYATYNLAGSLAAAVGALASGVPTLLLGSTPVTADPLRPMFLVYSLLGITAIALSLALPASVELRSAETRRPLTALSRSRVTRMASLFAVDSFAGGLVVQSFVALWFYQTYPESRAVLPAVFFLAGILSALSFPIAARLGERFGLLETMVFSHIPANVCLILMPIVPGFAPALAVFLVRMGLSQMDVPTRQAYLAGIVAPEERTAANAVTNTARNVSHAAGPFSSSALVALGFFMPFVVAGSLKIVYDVSMYSTFRKVRPEAV